jgi:hypothetical protein
MVRDVGQAISVRELSGAWPGGADSGKWTPQFYDAVEIAQAEQRRLDAAIEDACDDVRKTMTPLGNK